MSANSVNWGLANINVASAWNTTNGNGSVVAVFDTGTDIYHPDLVNNLWVKPSNIPDSVSGTYGRNFTTSGTATNVMDIQGHGTHVAGTIASTNTNIGIATGAKILTVKVLGDTDGGQFSWLTAGLNYMTLLATQYNVNIVAANMSLGATTSLGSEHAPLSNALTVNTDRQEGRWWR